MSLLFNFLATQSFAYLPKTLGMSSGQWATTRFPPIVGAKTLSRWRCLKLALA